MSIPNNLKYTKSHEWVRLEGDGTATVGISQHAQELLGDMVFVETPAVGRKLKQSEECAVVESVKAASDLYLPVSGTVIGTNTALDSAPETVNSAPYSEGWILKVKVSDSNVAGLMDAEAYGKSLG